MNRPVNTWQVLHLLLSIMDTSFYFCSIQQVLNANGLRNIFADFQPPMRKTIMSTEQCSFQGLLRIHWTTLRTFRNADWLESHGLWVIHICFDAVRATLAAGYDWPHLKATAVHVTRVVETRHGKCVARCSPSLSALLQEDGLDLVYSTC